MYIRDKPVQEGCDQGRFEITESHLQIDLFQRRMVITGRNQGPFSRGKCRAGAQPQSVFPGVPGTDQPQISGQGIVYVNIFPHNVSKKSAVSVEIGQMPRPGKRSAERKGIFGRDQCIEKSGVKSGQFHKKSVSGCP